MRRFLFLALLVALVAGVEGCNRKKTFVTAPPVPPKQTVTATNDAADTKAPEAEAKTEPKAGRGHGGIVTEGASEGQFLSVERGWAIGGAIARRARGRAC